MEPIVVSVSLIRLQNKRGKSLGLLPRWQLRNGNVPTSKLDEHSTRRSRMPEIAENII